MATLKPMPHNCGTCPFKSKDPKWRAVRGLLERRALGQDAGSPICHSTGPEALTSQGATKLRDEPHVCRGARDLQLITFHALGVIAAPTDQAWAEAWEAMKK